MTDADTPLDISAKLADIDRILADRNRTVTDRDHRWQPFLAVMSGMTVGAALFAAGGTFMNLFG
ncbi:hypothetical protein [Bradyrhizobium sp. URHD0069]|uniref:hypothetical protein n=1 Tax=Bradyrhizobium sp. URHD0069 TaxID=1380355 RepID=UPI000497A957|nr:hypothetical protein [Bradyrhizobium sp. URHD0069]